MTENFPKLAPPGAGLPFLQNLIARYILLPKFFRKTSWQTAQKMFQKEGERILSTAEGLNDAQLTKRILVDPIQGIEDSSRYWSIAMVMEHLIIVGEIMSTAVTDLSHGKVPDEKRGIADVKPLGEITSKTALTRFAEFEKKFIRDTTQNVGDRESKLSCKHPWFGKLTAHQWLCLSALHQRIHRLQAEAIRKKL